MGEISFTDEGKKVHTIGRVRQGSGVRGQGPGVSRGIAGPVQGTQHARSTGWSRPRPERRLRYLNLHHLQPGAFAQPIVYHHQFSSRTPHPLRTHRRTVSSRWLIPRP
jgi:hypothetical protein